MRMPTRSVPLTDNGIPLDIEQNFDEMIECIKEYIEAHPEKESYFGLGYGSERGLSGAGTI